MSKSRSKGAWPWCHLKAFYSWAWHISWLKRYFGYQCSKVFIWLWIVTQQQLPSEFTGLLTLLSFESVLLDTSHYSNVILTNVQSFWFFKGFFFFFLGGGGVCVMDNHTITCIGRKLNYQTLHPWGSSLDIFLESSATIWLLKTPKNWKLTTDTEC